MNLDLQKVLPAEAFETEQNEGDYIGKDGLLYCGVCRTKKQTRLPASDFTGGREIIVPCICKCKVEENKRKEEEEKKRQEMQRLERLKASSLMDAKLKAARLDGYQVDGDNQKIYNLAGNYVKRFDEMYEKRQGLLFWGTVGTGKSYTAACIANELLDQMIPVVMTSFVKILQNIQGKDPKGTRYCLQMDVHHCYPSVDQDILIERWHQKVKDADFNIENDKVIRASPFGLAPGSPTSVWHIHFLFTPFDHWLSQQDGVEYSIRHMDDIIAFGPNKKKLHKVERDSIEYMKREYNMEINHNHQVFPIEWKDRKGKIHGRPLDVCGYLFYRDKTIMRKSHMIRTTRKATKMDKKERITFYDAEQLLCRTPCCLPA